MVGACARPLLRRTRMRKSLEAGQPHGTGGGSPMTSAGVCPAPQIEAGATPAPPGFRPAQIIEAELTRPLPALRPDGERQRAWVLARLHTEPVGACILSIPDE